MFFGLSAESFHTGPSTFSRKRESILIVNEMVSQLLIQSKKTSSLRNHCRDFLDLLHKDSTPQDLKTHRAVFQNFFSQVSIMLFFPKQTDFVRSQEPWREKVVVFFCTVEVTSSILCPFQINFMFWKKKRYQQVKHITFYLH